ncbi:MAG: LysM peptidoglycan-binding domain-containing protein, partial [Bacteroidota bacterium]
YSVTAKKQPGKWHTVRPGETAAKLAELYGYTESRFREFNNLSAGKILNPGAVVRSSECSCGDAMATPTLASRGVATPPPATTNREYMTLAESAMIDEINLMRANPAAYVPYVRDFVANQKTTMGKAYSATYVNSLIADLQKSPKLSMLQAHPCLYQTAMRQGDYLRRTKSFSHQDASGTGPWSRTKNACPQVELGSTKLRNGMTVGNENLVAGFSTARQALIYLLIDEYEPTLGHRATLLAPEWRYVGAYNFGTINQMPNHYVQLFAR